PRARGGGRGGGQRAEDPPRRRWHLRHREDVRPAARRRGEGPGPFRCVARPGSGRDRPPLMEGVTQVVLAVSAVLVAVVAGAGAAWKIWKAIDKVEDAWAVLSDIAEQFKPNGGQSLYDRITSLEH